MERQGGEETRSGTVRMKAHRGSLHVTEMSAPGGNESFTSLSFTTSGFPAKMAQRTSAARRSSPYICCTGLPAALGWPSATPDRDGRSREQQLEGATQREGGGGRGGAMEGEAIGGGGHGRS